MVPSTSEAATRLAAEHAELNERARAGRIAGYAEERTHIVDLFFERRLGELAGLTAGMPPFVLMAVGGYGRGELNPGSDLDVLVLFAKKVPKQAAQLARDLLHPLWDTGMDLGHGVRTIADCVGLSKTDGQVLSSLLDARPLAGEGRLFGQFLEAFRSKVLAKRSGFLASWLQEQNADREARYGDSSELLEPELKNGLGGLRDAHQVGWILQVLPHLPKAKNPFLPEELAALKSDTSFLIRVRTALHVAAGRKNDRLVFDLQRRVAELLGFVATDADARGGGRAVEFFLSRLHESMGRIKAMREALFREIMDDPRFRGRLPDMRAENLVASRRGVSFIQPGGISADQMLALFTESADTGLPPSWSALRAVRNNLRRLGPKLAQSPTTLPRLLEILMAPHGAQAAEALDATGLLSELVPEFGAVRSLVQFDDYHLHAVGRHTLHAIAHLTRCLRGAETGRFCDEMRMQKHPERIVLAALFHDLGKLESDHSAVGAKIARKALSRMGADAETIEEVAFLVRQHLLLPVTATRRDLSDENVVARVASVVGTEERLMRLALLWAADSRATGPRADNGWNRSLVAELVSKVLRMLAHGPMAEPDAGLRIQLARHRARELADGRIDPEFADRCLDAMPTRALLVLSPERLVRHMGLARDLTRELEDDLRRKPGHMAGKGVCVIDVREASGGCREVAIAALDRPGLFATLAGALSLHGFDIHAADVFTWTDRTGVDVFTVSRPADERYADELFARLKSSISYALVGKLDIPGRLAERRSSPLGKGRKGPALKPVVRIDNEASDFFTVVEVAAADRLGLLHDVAHTLSEHGLQIHLAKVGTMSGRVADIFHVRRADGLRLEDAGEIEALKADLLLAARA